MKNHYDIADNEIKPGDFVIYAALWSRTAALKYGIVTRLAEREDGALYDRDAKYTIRVLSVDRDHDDKWEIQKEGKEMALGFLSRLLVVPSELVPTQAKAILRKAYQQWLLK